jgi:hypothetical protein
VPLIYSGQLIQFNRRIWSVRVIRELAPGRLDLELLGMSAASMGMNRHFTAIVVGPEIFISRRRGGYWHANQDSDWQDSNAGPALICRDVTELELLNAHTQYPHKERPLNDFSWSFSRQALYQFCPRAYYYHYYAAWQGWKQQSPPPVRQTYLLKNLTSVSQWQRTLVRDAIQSAVAEHVAGRAVSGKAAINRTIRRARNEYETSSTGRYREDPANLTGFQEHYYNISVPDAVWKDAWQNIERQLETFFSSSFFQNLRQQSSETFSKLSPLQSFTLAGTKIWVQLDLVQHTDDKITLYVWKTKEASREEQQLQLGIYGLFARHVWPQWSAVPLEGVVYALPANQTEKMPLPAKQLATTQSKVETSARQLQHLLYDPTANRAQIRRFPMISDLQVCCHCRFRELCSRA